MAVPLRGESVSVALARRIALAAQGFGGRAPSENSPASLRALRGTVGRLALLQIDSVNVFERSHYLPAFARNGSYRKADLDRITYGPEMTEYWAHEASFIPHSTWPLLRWRMDEFRARTTGHRSAWAAENQPMLQWLLTEIATSGPLPASSIEHDANRRTGPWWGWSDVKLGLEVLFRQGDVVAAPRTRFERVYALPEQVFGAHILDHLPGRADAIRELVAQSARAHGIGTAKDIADYFRLKTTDTVSALRELEETGEVTPVVVRGWTNQAWLHRDARMPRRISAAALLSPFDPVVWARERAERLFGFHYRLEIYTPEPQRRWGYYSLPVLLDDTLAGRIDLKSDRQARALRVQSAWREPAAPDGLAERIAPVVIRAARWQGLESVEVTGRGDLAESLQAELRALGTEAG